jgi:hypothetical protein
MIGKASRQNQCGRNQRADDGHEIEKTCHDTIGGGILHIQGPEQRAGGKSEADVDESYQVQIACGLLPYRRAHAQPGATFPLAADRHQHRTSNTRAGSQDEEAQDDRSACSQQ